MRRRVWMAAMASFCSGGTPGTSRPWQRTQAGCSRAPFGDRHQSHARVPGFGIARRLTLVMYRQAGVAVSQRAIPTAAKNTCSHQDYLVMEIVSIANRIVGGAPLNGIEIYQ
jgi:hypothetical protein